ncbi:MAG: DUF835 domain-containing protein, partial [Thermoplasmata archaeon]|nr:DUF835 domain-containing protein [Thermoplasmata archaeon]
LLNHSGDGSGGGSGGAGEPVVAFSMGVAGEEGCGEEHLSNPNDVVSDGERIFVADRYNNRVQVFDMEGHYLSTVDGVGDDGPGGFNQPCGLGIDVGDPESGREWRLYIADTYNDRVLAYDANLTYIGVVGTGLQGEGPGEFRHPYDVEVAPDGRIYVLDTDNFRVQVFSPGNLSHVETLLSGVGGFDPDEVRWPCGFDLRGGRMVIADTYNNRIQVLDDEGGYLFTIGSNGSTGSDEYHFFRPRKVDMDAVGNIWVADSNNNRIQVYSPNGTYLFSLGSTYGPPFDDRHFYKPSGVAIQEDAGGGRRLYVVDSNNHRVQVYTPLGEKIHTIGPSSERISGGDQNHFFVPRDATVGDGEIFVADTGNARIQVFSERGVFLRQLNIDCYKVEYHNGFLYSSPSAEHIVKVTDTQGNMVQTLGTEGSAGSDMEHMNFPQGVAVDDEGRVYVADYGNHRVLVYDDLNDGVADHVIGVTGEPGGDLHHLKNPSDVKVSGDRLYIADQGNQRIVVYSMGEGEGAGSSPGYSPLYIIGVTGVSGDDNAHFDSPWDLALDSEGTLYVADLENDRVLMVYDLTVDVGNMENSPPWTPWYREPLWGMPLGAWLLILLLVPSLGVFLASYLRQHRGRKPVRLPPRGQVYRLERGLDKAYEIYMRAREGGVPGLCITRTKPNILKETRGIPEDETIWVSSSLQENTVAPTDIHKMLFLVKSFGDDNPGGLVLIDCLDHISTRVPDRNFMEFLGTLSETAALTDIRILAPIHPEAHSVRVLSFLRDETRTLPEGES